MSTYISVCSAAQFFSYLTPGQAESLASLENYSEFYLGIAEYDAAVARWRAKNPRGMGLDSAELANCLRESVGRVRHERLLFAPPSVERDSAWELPSGTLDDAGLSGLSTIASLLDRRSPRLSASRLAEIMDVASSRSGRSLGLLRSVGTPMLILHGKFAEPILCPPYTLASTAAVESEMRDCLSILEDGTDMDWEKVGLLLDDYSRNSNSTVSALFYNLSLLHACVTVAMERHYVVTIS